MVWSRANTLVAVIVTISAAGLVTAAVAQSPDQPTDIGTVRATGSGRGDGPSLSPSVPDTAAQYAPSRPNLDQIEPTSVIGADTIAKVAVPTENYNDIIRLTPSVQDISPVGPGLQQDFGQSIRGLQYGQFSVLYDGIPIPGFPFNFSPQTGIYFTGRDTGAITVHRGPGQASAIGAATFGGYIDILSPAVSNTLGGAAYGTVGSFNTFLGGVEANTGAIGSLNGARARLNLEQLESDGAGTGNSTERRHGQFKYEQPIGDNTLVTALVNLDHTFTRTPYGTTLANIQAFGRSYSLNNDPTSQTFRNYNHDDYKTDFEYLNVKSALGAGFKLDNTVYSTSYYQHSFRGLDVGGQGPNLSGVNYLDGVTPVDLTGDVPGNFAKYYFRNTGDILRLSKDTPYGQARIGVWGEHELLTLSDYLTDNTIGFRPYTSAPGSIYLSRFRSNLDTVQPYGEFAWNILPNLTFTSGVKYSLTTRTLKGEAGLTGGPQDVSQSYSTPLPAFDVNWRVKDWASLYAQAARGYETPNLNLFSASQLTSVNPSTTWSYQIGGVIKRPAFDIGGNLYYIQYDNFVNSQTVGGFTTYFNQGGADYKGMEIEGTARLTHGFAFYANGSLNSSEYSNNGNVLAQTPRYTAAFGPIYDQGNIFRDEDELYGSFIGKFVGPQYGLDTSATGQHNSFPIKSYNQFDFAAGYTLPVRGKKLLFKLNVYNITDDKSILGYAGSTIGPPSEALYWVNAGRSVFFSLEARI